MPGSYFFPQNSKTTWAVPCATRETFHTAKGRRLAFFIQLFDSDKTLSSDAKKFDCSCPLQEMIFQSKRSCELQPLNWALYTHSASWYSDGTMTKFRLDVSRKPDETDTVCGRWWCLPVWSSWLVDLSFLVYWDEGDDSYSFSFLPHAHIQTKQGKGISIVSVDN